MRSIYSFIITQSGGQSRRFNASSLVVKGLIALCGIVFFGFLTSVALNVKLGIHYSNTKQIVQDQEEQVKVIKTLTDELQSLRQLVDDLIQKEEEIRQDLGKPKYRKLSNRRRIRSKRRQFDRNYPKNNQPLFVTHQLSREVEFLKKNVLTLEKRMRRHMAVYDQYKSWFDETPSIWPVYGYIRSGYGWRTHPLRRKRQFHKGIDIPAWIGAPVQATADGYVEFAGYGGGYGWMIVISHKFGYKTIYAHLSEIEVTQSTRVFKGQIIGKIGNSGLSTGPHIHYEILRRRKAVEPTQFLNLDLFTAVSKLW